eukprot:TRINITY_DN2442_c0_g1_i4.p1 TRINITY_DN2442_c0_g1~~TRINITY_DN2442_c0_g1_i4.p1  ORF type:complete len:152 (-),score=44.80 TRINITY_DN2442_c0_g1_i4:124-519(-)
MGYKPSDEEMFEIVCRVDADGSGTLDMDEFLKLVDMQKSRSFLPQHTNMINAFVALGGHPDRSGSMDSRKLQRIIKEDFQLTIPIDDLLADIDPNDTGFIDFEQFRRLLTMQARSPPADVPSPRDDYFDSI